MSGPGDLSAKLLLMGEADKVRVFDLVEHLRKSFNAFFGQNETIQPHIYSQVDIFMAVHNFHKLTVVNAARQILKEPEQRAVYFKMAADTFRGAMEEEIAAEKIRKEQTS